MDLSGQQQVSTIQQQQIVFSVMAPDMVTPPEAAFPVSEKMEQTSQATINALSSPLLLLDARMRNMSSTIIQWKGKTAALQVTVTEREAQIATMQQEIALLEQQMARLISANREFDAKLSGNEQLIANNEAKIATLEQENSTLTQQGQQLSDANNQLLNKTASLEKTCADYEAYIAVMDQENAGLKQQVDQFSSANSQMLNGLNNLLTQFVLDDDTDGFLAPSPTAFSESGGHAYTH